MLESHHLLLQVSHSNSCESKVQRVVKKKKSKIWQCHYIVTPHKGLLLVVILSLYTMPLSMYQISAKTMNNYSCIYTAFQLSKRTQET